MACHQRRLQHSKEEKQKGSWCETSRKVMASGKMAQKLARFPKLGFSLGCVPISDLTCLAEGSVAGELPNSTELGKNVSWRSLLQSELYSRGIDYCGLRTL